jgi:hypothetical protein
MATPFDVALANFEQYAWSAFGPRVGGQVSEIIQRSYVAPMRARRGLGDAGDVGSVIAGPTDAAGNPVDPITGQPLGSILDLPGATVTVPSPAQTVVSDIASFFKTLSTAVLGGAQAYYTTQGKLADLQAQAKGSTATQTLNALKPTPASWVLWAALGLGAILLLRPPPAAPARR